MPVAVDVFRIRLSAGGSHAQAWLADDERARAARFRRPLDRDHYSLAHAALRSILAARVGVAPQALVFSMGAHGKPALPGIEFNLSHAGGIALVAVALVPVGVDVERIEPLDVAALASRQFSPTERLALERVPPAHRLAAFYGGWTRKEAFVKATGAGLSRALTEFDVSIGAPAALLATRPDAGEARRWCLTDIEAGAGYSAALCVAGAEAPAVSWSEFSL